MYIQSIGSSKGHVKLNITGIREWGIYDWMGGTFMAWVGQYGKVSFVWKYAGLQGSTLSNHCTTTVFGLHVCANLSWWTLMCRQCWCSPTWYTTPLYMYMYIWNIKKGRSVIHVHSSSSFFLSRGGFSLFFGTEEQWLLDSIPSEREWIHWVWRLTALKVSPLSKLDTQKAFLTRS